MTLVLGLAMGATAGIAMLAVYALLVIALIVALDKLEGKP